MLAAVPRFGDSTECGTHHIRTMGFCTITVDFRNFSLRNWVNTTQNGGHSVGLRTLSVHAHAIPTVYVHTSTSSHPYIHVVLVTPHIV